MRRSNELETRLLKYSSAAAAVLGTSGLEAQILYTDVNPDEVLYGNTMVYPFDLNQDGVNDFMPITVDTLYGSAPVKGALIGYYYTYTYGAGNSSNMVVESSNGVAKLDAAEPVDNNRNWQAGGFLGLKLYGYPIYNLPWDSGDQDKFVGLRLELNGNYHYGWVRLDVTAASDTVIVKDMAVNLTAGDPIQTGATGLSTIEALKEMVQFSQGSDFLQVLTDPTFGEYVLRVTDLSGKTMREEQSRAGEPNRWQTASWPKGIYVLYIQRDDYILSEKFRVD